MKTYHKCVICNNNIMGGDVCISQEGSKDFAHQICVVNKRIKDTKSSYFDFFECSPFKGDKNETKGKKVPKGS